MKLKTKYYFKGLFLLLLILNISFAQAQTAKEYNTLATKAFKSNLDSALLMANRAKESASKTKDYLELGYAYKNLATIQYYKSDKKNAISFFLKAIDEFNKVDNFTEVANIYHNVGLMHYHLNNSTQAAKYYHLAIATNQKHNPKVSLVGTYNGLAVLFQDISQYDSSTYYLNLAYKFIDKLDTNRIANLYNSLGRNFIYQGMHDSALIYYSKSYKLRKNQNTPSSLAQSIENIGQVLGYKANYDTAISCYFMALEIYDKYDQTIEKARVFNKIGNIYLEIQDTLKSETYYNKSLEIYKKENDLINQAGIYNNLGLIQQTKNNFNNAKLLFLKAEALLRTQTSPSVLSETYQNLSAISMDLENYSNAIIYLNKSNKIALKYNLIKTYLDNSLSLALIYHKQKKDNLAYQQINSYFNEQIQYNQTSDSSLESLSVLAEIYEKLGKYKDAYEISKKYKSLNNKQLNEKLFNIVAEMNTKYETERIEKENEIFKKQSKIERLKIDKQEEENKTNRIIIFSTLSVLLAAFFGLFLLYKNNIARKKHNEELLNKNIVISEQNHEIEQHLDLLSQQKEILEGQKEEITDSINYAKRFQTAITPTENRLKSIFPNSFVLYRPRDIVSGDFYYIHKTKDYKYFIAADSTGHGVPGAFLSIIGHNGLSGALTKFAYTDLSDIIKFLNDYLFDFLHQNQDMKIQDGIDLTIVRIDQAKKEISYTGAYNPLVLVRNGELTAYKTNKFAIGAAKENIFKVDTISYCENDTIYLFSDGYADQFGGPKGKKFMRKNFYKKLSEISQIQIDKQHSNLEKSLVEWMKHEKQLDDIIVAGIQL